MLRQVAIRASASARAATGPAAAAAQRRHMAEAVVAADKLHFNFLLPGGAIQKDAAVVRFVDWGREELAVVCSFSAGSCGRVSGCSWLRVAMRLGAPAKGAGDLAEHERQVAVMAADGRGGGAPSGCSCGVVGLGRFVGGGGLVWGDGPTVLLF